MLSSDERRPATLTIPEGLEALAPPRPAQSPVLPASGRPSFIDRVQADGGPPALGGFSSLDHALLPQTRNRALSASSGTTPAPRTSSDEELAAAAVSRSAEFSRTLSEPGSSGKRFRQTVCDPGAAFGREAIMPREKLLTCSAPAETPLPDMTPRARLLKVVESADGCECIDGDALESLMKGQTAHEAYHIIDCRFQFEHGPSKPLPPSPSLAAASMLSLCCAVMVVLGG